MEVKTTRRILFFQVTNSQQKIDRLTEIARQKFIEKTPLLILAQDSYTAEFVDKILWEYPVHSLTPHEFTLNNSEETVCVSLPSHNPNKSKHIFNLTKTPILEASFEIVYEFDDITTPEKATISRQKYHVYKEAKFALASF